MQEYLMDLNIPEFISSEGCVALRNRSKFCFLKDYCLKTRSRLALQLDISSFIGQ